MTELSDKLIILMSTTKYFKMTFMSVGVSMFNWVMLSAVWWHKSCFKQVARVQLYPLVAMKTSFKLQLHLGYRQLTRQIRETYFYSTIPWILKREFPASKLLDLVGKGSWYALRRMTPIQLRTWWSNESLSIWNS